MALMFENCLVFFVVTVLFTSGVVSLSEIRSGSGWFENKLRSGSAWLLIFCGWDLTFCGYFFPYGCPRLLGYWNYILIFQNI